MKTLKYAIILTSLVGIAGMANAVTEKYEKSHKKHEPKKHTFNHTKKHSTVHHITKSHAVKSTPKATTRSKISSPKTAAQTKVAAHKEATAPVAKPTQTATSNKATESTGSKISKWLGFGAASTATAAAAGHVVHHRGPQDWHKKHRFAHGWNEGFTGKWVGNEWLFAGHNLAWWHENEPVYYRDVVRPEATKAGVPRQHFEK